MFDASSIGLSVKPPPVGRGGRHAGDLQSRHEVSIMSTAR
jgi:hypothetical protein